MNYDIFISCKSEDYPVARKVYQYLKGQKYSVFLADTELRKKGNAEYGKIIDEALDTATHMIIIASNPEYVRSTYVESEWRIFMEEKRVGRKTGNIISLIDGIDICDLPISLRHFQSFNFKNIERIKDFLPLKQQKKNHSIPSFFPLYGIVLGETKVQELDPLRFNIDYEMEDGTIWIKPDTGYESEYLTFYADSQTSVITDVEIDGEYGFPLNWKKLGMSWDMSYNQFMDFFKSINFDVKILENPHKEFWEEKNYEYLEACFKASVPNEKLCFFLNFSYGDKGFDINSPETLFEMVVSTKKQSLICELDGYDEYQP